MSSVSRREKEANRLPDMCDHSKRNFISSDGELNELVRRMFFLKTK